MRKIKNFQIDVTIDQVFQGTIFNDIGWMDSYMSHPFCLENKGQSSEYQISFNLTMFFYTQAIIRLQIYS